MDPDGRRVRVAAESGVTPLGDDPDQSHDPPPPLSPWGYPVLIGGVLLIVVAGEKSFWLAVLVGAVSAEALSRLPGWDRWDPRK